MDVFSIIPLLFTIMIVIGIFKGFSLLQSHSFKALTDAFERINTVQNGERIPEFYFGQIRLRNVMQISEDSLSFSSCSFS